MLGALVQEESKGGGRDAAPSASALDGACPSLPWAGLPVPFTGVQSTHLESQVAVSSELLERISPRQKLSTWKTFEAHCPIALESLCAHLCPCP